MSLPEGPRPDLENRLRELCTEREYLLLQLERLEESIRAVWGQLA